MDISEVEHVECDSCNESFIIKLIEKSHPGKVIESYFKCPSCDEKYITHVTDEWVRKEQEKIKELNEEKIRRQNNLSMHMAGLKDKIAST